MRRTTDTNNGHATTAISATELTPHWNESA